MSVHVACDPRREERKRHEEAIAKAAAEAEERLRAAEDEARRERDAMRRAHEKQARAWAYTCTLMAFRVVHYDMHALSYVRTHKWPTLVPACNQLQLEEVHAWFIPCQEHT